MTAYGVWLSDRVEDLDPADLARLRDRGAVVGTKGRVLTPEQALAGAAHYRDEHGSRTAEVIARDFGLEVRQVAPLMPIPCRPDHPKPGAGVRPWPRPVRFASVEVESDVPVSLGPVIVNSSIPILEGRPKGWEALRKKLEKAGWTVRERWGQTPGLAVRELVRSEEGPGRFEVGLAEVVSLSLRAARGDERAVAIWSTRDDGGTWSYELGRYRGLTSSMGIRAWTRTMLLEATA